MRYAVLFSIMLAACSGRSTPAASDTSAASIAALRDTLIRFGAEDQQGRDSVAIAVTTKDTAFLKRLASGDSARTLWLKKTINERGWPRKSLVGDSASGAAWLIVQHSPMMEFQEQVLSLLEKETQSGEVKPAEYAMLFDRVESHRHRPQRYGTQFSLNGGRLTADSIENLHALDSLRAAVGLPPMSDYVPMLAQMFKMPVEWPPSVRKAGEALTETTA